MKNPPAFPHSHLGIDKGQLSYEDSDYSDGMTLRDYFAAKAMQAYVAVMENRPRSAFDEQSAIVARCSYSLADAMLEARTQ